MEPKPKGRRYRHLEVHGVSIRFRRRRKGKALELFGLETDNWEHAADLAEEYRAGKATIEGTEPEELVSSLTFGEASDRFLKVGLGDRAGTTSEDHGYVLSAAVPDKDPARRRAGCTHPGPARALLGAVPIAKLCQRDLALFWERAIVARGHAEPTGLRYLTSISQVWEYARDLELVEGENPALAFRRRIVRRRGRTKAARSKAEDHRNPLVGDAALARFWLASREFGAKRLKNGRPLEEHRRGALADALMLFTGLRLGEAEALRWRNVHLADDPADPSTIDVRDNRARRKFEGKPKSGRARVGLEVGRELRDLLLAERRRQREAALRRKDGPRWSEADLVVGRLHNYGERHFAKVAAVAGVPDRTPKDLRSTFASTLVSHGMPLDYVQRALGHADPKVTAKHYAKFRPSNGRLYVAPEELDVEAGDVPADLIARAIRRGVVALEAGQAGRATA